MTRRSKSKFLSRENSRNVDRALWSSDLLHPRQVLIEHLAVKEQQRRKGLLVGRGRDPLLRCEKCQKSLYLASTHFPRVPQPMIHNELPHPIRVSSFRTQTVMTV